MIPDRSLWQKYRAGTASREELMQLEAWMQSAAFDELVFAEWVREEGMQRTMPEEMAGKLRVKLQQTMAQQEEKQGPADDLKRVRGRLILFRAAAAVLFLVVAGYWRFGHLPHGPIASTPMAWDTIRNMGRTPKMIHLSEGSRIWLNTNTVVYINKNFETDRQTRLEGEGYFEIARDEHHPFRVLAGNIETVVLGTAFNIDHRPGESATYISLIKGSVKVQAIQAGPSSKRGADLEGVILSPGQMAVLRPEDTAAAVSRIGVPDAAGWIGGDLVFDQLPLAEALQRLADYYQIRIQADPALVAGKAVTAIYHKKESWQQVMKHLLFIYQMTWRVERDNQLTVLKQ